MNVIRTGPVFDGQAAAMVNGAAASVKAALEKEADQLAVELFTQSIKVSKGVFLGSIHVESITMSSSRVTTDIVTYGPWLEGTSSRNQTTRFKGYAGFRRAAQQLDSRAEAIAEALVAPVAARCSLLCSTTQP